jgi:hypothetical protein
MTAAGNTNEIQIKNLVEKNWANGRCAIDFNTK